MPGSYNLGTASGRIEIDGKGGAAGFNVAKTAADGFMGAIKKKTADVEQFGRRLTVAGGAGVAAFGLAVRAAASFEQQMSAVQAVTGAAGKDFDDLRQKALDLGRDTVFSASEAANAIEELAKAGIPVRDILNGAAEGAVNLAAAGGIGLAEAAEIAANALNQFNLKADKTTKVADILAGVANTSASDVSGIGQSLSQAGAVANLAGLKFRDTAIALGEMADQGIKGSDAGTSLKTMLNNLIPTTTAQINEFKRLGLLTTNLSDANKTLAKVLGPQYVEKSLEGVQDRLAEYVESLGQGTIGTMKNKSAVQKLLMQYGGLNNEFFDSKGNIKDLGKLQGVLEKSTKGMTRQQKLASLELLFGSDAMRASAILTNKGAKGYREFSKEVGKTTAADVAKTRLNNLGGAIEQLKGSFETAQITIGNIFLPIITKMIQFLTKVVNAFNNLPGPVKTAIGIIVGLVSVLSIMIGLFLASITAIAAFILQWYAFRIIRVATTWLRAYIATSRAGAGAQAAFTAANTAAGKSIRRTTLLTKLATKATILMGKAALLTGKILRFAMSPVGLILIALVVAFILLYRHSSRFRAIVQAIGKAIKGYLITAWNALKPVLAAGLALLIRVGQYIGRTLEPVLRKIGAVLKGEFLKALSTIWDAIQSDLLPAVRELVSQFQGNVVPAVKKVGSALAPLLAVVGKVAAIVGIILFRAWVKYAQFMISTVLPILIKIVGFIAGTMIKALATAILGIIKVITSVVKIITGVVKLIKAIFSGDWSAAWDAMKEIASAALGALKGFFMVMFSVVITLFKQFGMKALNALLGFFSGADGATGGWVSRIIGWFVGFGKGVIKVVVRAFNTVKDFISDFLTGIQVIWSAYWNTFGPVIKGVFGVILAIIKLAWTLIKGIFLMQLIAVVAVVRAAFNLVWGIIKGAFNIIKAIVMAGAKFVVGNLKRQWAVLKAITQLAWKVLGPIVGAAINFIKKRMAEVRTAVVIMKQVWDRVKTIVTTAWQKLKETVAKGITNIVNKIREAKSKFLDPILHLGKDMYDAGAKLMDMLLQGITKGLEAVKDKITDATGWIADHMPGSPVKLGALKSFNNGKTGRKLMEMFAKGLSDTRPVEQAMRHMATYVNGSAAAIAPHMQVHAQNAVWAPTPGRGIHPAQARYAAASKGDSGKSGKSRIVSGVLRIDESGRAWIEGIAEDVYDEQSNENDRKFARGQ